MRNLKKFLALVLAMMMAFSLVVTASAAKWNSAGGPFDDSTGVTEAFDEGVSVVTGMKIFEGDDKGDFRPSDTITRAEAAAVVYRLATGDVKNAEGKDDSYLWTNVAPFIDVTPDKWYAGYVGYLWNAEIIKGANAERTMFNPTEKVTGYEVLAMVLRAMGYDENDEFTGGGWQIRVGQTANDRNLLVNVNTTNYGSGHLNAAARRDTIAEIIFQAAKAATVVYTPAFGYQTGNVTNAGRVDTTSLGYANFGLNYQLGVVVGNQATGESVTKLGVATRGADEYYTRTITEDSYNYTGIRANDQDNNVTYGTNNVTGSIVFNFDHDSPRGQFGHANKVWYNDYANSQGIYHTYAWVDQATEAKIVYTRDDDDFASDGSAVFAQAKSAGFTVDVDSVFGSDKYDRMQPLNGTVDDVSDGRLTARDNSEMNSEEIHMYALISNSANKKLDVVIALDAEVVKIYDTNTTDSATRLVMRYAEHGGEAAGRLGGEILISHLTKASVQTLGADVTAWVIDGTADTDADSNLKSYYETVAVKEGPTATVSTVDETNGDVYLTNGTKLEMSRLYDVVRYSDHPARTGSIGVSFTQPEPLSAGVTYTFVLDEFGHYLGTTTKTERSFLYATFADHSYGQVGSGELSYLVYGIDENGNVVKDHVLTELDKGNDADFNVMNGAQFLRLEVARRDYGTAQQGNQVAPGVYRAGWISPEGKWEVNAESTDGTDGNWEWGNTVTKNGTANNWNDSEDWEITSADAGRGFKDVSAAQDGSLLVTNNTEFYVVSGTGTATLNAKKFTGMTQFLDGATQVIIESQYKEDLDGDDDWTDEDNSYDVAYMTNFDTYHSVGDRPNQNAMVTKVFMYEKAVKRNSTTTLYYVHDNTPSSLQIVKDNVTLEEYRQYEMWQGATKYNYFLSGDIIDTDGTRSAGTPTADTFYTLQKADTVNGIDVYDLVAVGLKGTYANDSRNVCWENENIDYFATNDTSTARIGGKANAADMTVYGVKNATVVDLTKLSTRHSDEGCEADGDHDAHNEIKSVADLFNAISVGYDVDVSIINDGSNVSLIYVVHVDNAPIGRP